MTAAPRVDLSDEDEDTADTVVVPEPVFYGVCSAPRPRVPVGFVLGTEYVKRITAAVEALRGSQ